MGSTFRLIMSLEKLAQISFAAHPVVATPMSFS